MELGNWKKRNRKSLPHFRNEAFGDGYPMYHGNKLYRDHPQLEKMCMRSNHRFAALCGVARDVAPIGAKPVDADHKGDSVRLENVVERLPRSTVSTMESSFAVTSFRYLHHVDGRSALGLVRVLDFSRSARLL